MKRLTALVLLLAVLLSTAGCTQIKWKAKDKDTGADLIYVQVVFDNGEKLNTYVKELGISKESTVFAGGITNSNMYDARGNQVGVFNYNRVHYMTVLAPSPQ